MCGVHYVGNVFWAIDVHFVAGGWHCRAIGWHVVAGGFTCCGRCVGVFWFGIGLPLLGRWLALCEQLTGMLWAQCQLCFFFGPILSSLRGGNAVQFLFFVFSVVFCICQCCWWIAIVLEPVFFFSFRKVLCLRQAPALSERRRRKQAVKMRATGCCRWPAGFTNYKNAC